MKSSIVGFCWDHMQRGGGGGVRTLVAASRRAGWTQQAARAFSVANREGNAVQHVALDRLAHQSRLQLLLSDATRAAIHVVPTLNQADFAFRVLDVTEGAATSELVDVFAVHEELVGDAVKAVKLVKDGSVGNGGKDLAVELHIPHLIDLDITAPHGTVSIVDKIEGNVKIALGDGDIRVNKLRGEQIQLKTNRGRVDVDTLVEGSNVKIAASALNVKRVMSESVDVKVGKGAELAEFGAIYAATCVINSSSSGSLKVGNVHGFLRVNAEGMEQISLNGINGAVHVEDSGASCSVDAHFDGWSTDAANKIFVGGEARISLDPSAPIDVELHGTRITTDGCEFNESELDQLDEDYAIFTGAVKPNESAKAGMTATSGKINVGSAKNAALRTSFFANDTEAGEAGDNIHPARLPRLVVHTSNGSVSLEQLDWMAKIKRKHLKNQ
ncbi:hypothetical protein Poli38472_013234 [Pythium oligandrum]|uniref:Adhesin domain-containing protein n=1 Tax=Pythium oligandrum TaxID=41045 RepID=A0A8K1C2U3_PYTOL|nr:hypothetical protein Poli38472_013234 [Pythium oligandrum]|eukprot:TMW55343.1 hypothetical protein Poli38472_013234 [Pythium oligandrum]